MDCDVDNPEQTCTRCGKPAKYRTTKRNCIKSDPQRGMTCVHLGEQCGEEVCKTCQGQVRIKLFACALHGVCSLEKSVGKQVCAKCTDYAKKT